LYILALYTHTSHEKMVVGVVAVVKLNEGKREQFFKHFQPVIEHVQQNEPDTIMYQIYNDRKDSNKVVIIERYKSQDALKKHGQSEPFKKFGAVLKSEQIGHIASIDVYNEVENVGFTSKM